MTDQYYEQILSTLNWGEFYKKYHQAAIKWDEEENNDPMEIDDEWTTVSKKKSSKLRRICDQCKCSYTEKHKCKEQRVVINNYYINININ